MYVESVAGSSSTLHGPCIGDVNCIGFLCLNVHDTLRKPRGMDCVSFVSCPAD